VPLPPVSLLPVFLVVGVVLLAMSYLERRRRTARARAAVAVAAEMDFTFATVDSYGLADLPFSLFLKTGIGKARLVISGTHNGLPLHIFDYEHYPNPESRRHDNYTCAVLTIPVACPWVRLLHENPLTRATRSDLDLEYDDFNRRFLVNCADRKAAFSLLDGQMMQWLLGAASIDRLEMVGPWVLIANSPVDPRSWRVLAEWLDEFRSHIPAVVYSTYPPR